MRKIILTMQISLDGIVSDVDQWMTLNDEIIEDSLEYYHTLYAIVVGGNTYPSLAAYWQNAEKSSASALERRFAKRINEIEKLVLSRSNVELIWKNSRQLPIKDGESLVREIESLKNDNGRNISVESGVGAWQAFIQNDLFDELWMWVHPVVVAQGEKLFRDAETKMTMHLSNSKVYKNGVVGLYYQKNIK
jgi:dihydrofolate reductase